MVNGLRYVVPYVHTFIIKVADKRVGGSVHDALAAHVRFQGQVNDGGREFWVGANADHPFDRAVERLPSFSPARVTLSRAFPSFHGRCLLPQFCAQPLRNRDAMAPAAAIPTHGARRRDERAPYRMAGEIAAGRVHVASDVLRRLPKGGEVPAEMWRVPASLDDAIFPDTRLRVTRHIHEPAVSAGVPRVLYEDARLCVVEKPAGVPTLAGLGPGLSGENTAIALLNRLRREGKKPHREGCDEDADELFAVNRIDKPVSGVWITAQDGRLSARVRAALSKPGAEAKTYLARVAGEFPKEGLLVEAPLRVGEDGRAAVGGAGAKHAATQFHPLAVVDVGNGRRETLVAARLTHAGRFHQIRVHLAHAGFPIANDVAYNGAATEAKVLGSSHPGLAGDNGGGHPIYVDDAAGSLWAMAVASHQPWCLECGWTLAALEGDPRVFSGDNEDPGVNPSRAGRLMAAREGLARHTNRVSGDRRAHAGGDGHVSTNDGAMAGGGRNNRPVAGQRIDLHSLEYRFLFDGREFHVQSDQLPAFATDALLNGEPIGGVSGEQGSTSASWRENLTVASVVQSLPWARASLVGGGGGGRSGKAKAKTSTGGDKKKLKTG